MAGLPPGDRARRGEQRPDVRRHPLDTPALNTLADAVEGLGRADCGLTFAERGERTTVTFAELRERALGVAHGLLAAGLRPGDRAVVVLPRQADFVDVFLGAVRAGIVPAPLYPPLGAGQLDAFAEHARRVAGLTGASAIVSVGELRDVLEPIGAGAPFLIPEDCRAAADALPAPRARPRDPVFLQFTSGSTAAPKGVVVTNRSLVANASFIAEHLRADAGRDRGVSWLPMYHDMGLIGFVLVPVLQQLPVWYLPPLEFARRPQAWCELIDEVRGTIAFGPNFAYALVARRARAEEIAGWDLSSWRVAGCGAEPVNAAELRLFAERLAPAGFDPTAILPCYGMAEATLAMTMAPLGGGLRTSRVAEREAVSCGRPGAGHRVGIVDRDDHSLPERREGEIVFGGPSVAAGYYGDPQSTATTFDGDAIHTGDSGFMADGELYVTGRRTDLIIVRGRNFHPHDIELAVAQVPGVRRGAVVALGTPGAGGGGDVTVVTEAADGADPGAIEAAAKARVHADFGLVAEPAIVVAKGSLPRTSSGKLRRNETRRRCIDGTLEPAADPPARGAPRVHPPGG